jgi:hypothetical protein
MPRADNRPGARLLDFLERGSTPAAQEEEPWKYYTRIVLA